MYKLQPIMKSWTWLLFLTLAACGGGGGGGHSSVSTSSASDTSKGTIVFKENDNSFDALPLSLIFSESLTQISQPAINAVAYFSIKGLHKSDCDFNNCRISIRFDDNDNNFLISNGDVFTIDFNESYDPFVEDYITGTFLVTIESFSLVNSIISISGIIDYTQQPTLGASNDSVTISGKHSFVYELDKSYPLGSESLVIDSVSGIDINFRNSSLNENIGYFHIEKLVSENDGVGFFKNRFSYDFFYKSGTLLSDSVTCSTSSYNSREDRGEISCYGRNSNSIKWTGIGSTIKIDSEGDGSYIATSLSLDYTGSILEGFLNGPEGFQFPSTSLGLDHTLLYADATAFTYWPTREAILLSTYKNNAYDLKLYHPSSGQVQTLKTFINEPSILHISPDEKFIYVAFKDKNILLKLSLDDLSLLGQITLADTKEIVDIDSSPQNTDIIALIVKEVEEHDYTSEQSSDIQIYNDINKLPNTYSSKVTSLSECCQRFNRITFTSDGSKIYGDDYGTTSAVLLDIDQDGVSKINIKSYIDYGKMLRANGFLYGGGSIIDETDGEIKGSSDLNFYSAVDEANQLFINLTLGELHVFDQASNSLLRTFQFSSHNENSTLIKVISLEGKLYIYDSGQFRVIDIDNILSNL